MALQNNALSRDAMASYSGIGQSGTGMQYMQAMMASAQPASGQPMQQSLPQSLPPSNQVMTPYSSGPVATPLMPNQSTVNPYVSSVVTGPGTSTGQSQMNQGTQSFPDTQAGWDALTPQQQQFWTMQIAGPLMYLGMGQ